MMKRLREATKSTLCNLAENIFYQFTVIYNGSETFISLSFIKSSSYGTGSDNSASEKSTRHHMSPTGYPSTR